MFNANVATENGGAICFAENCSVSFYCTTFTANQAKNGGAVYGGSISSYGTIMERNFATNGGAIYSKGSVNLGEAYANSGTKNSSIKNNIATYGGGIYLADPTNGQAIAYISLFGLVTQNIATYGGGIYAEGLCNVGVVDSLANLSGNILDVQATGAKGKDLYLNTYTNGSISSSVGYGYGYEPTVKPTANSIGFYFDGYVDLNTVVASAPDAETAALIASHITFENGYRIGVVGTNVVVVKEAYAVTFNPDGGTITYNSTETTSTLILYTTATTSKLYIDEALTTEVTSISIAKDDAEGKKAYTFLGWTCDGGNTLAKDILRINVAEGSEYVALFSEENLAHTYNITASGNGSVSKTTITTKMHLCRLSVQRYIFLTNLQTVARKFFGLTYYIYSLIPNFSSPQIFFIISNDSLVFMFFNDS